MNDAIKTQLKIHWITGNTPAALVLMDQLFENGWITQKELRALEAEFGV